VGIINDSPSAASDNTTPKGWSVTGLNGYGSCTISVQLPQCNNGSGPAVSGNFPVCGNASVLGTQYATDTATITCGP